jgi:hypothetical protein
LKRLFLIIFFIQVASVCSSKNFNDIERDNKFIDWFVGQLGQLKEETCLGEWKRCHPNERIDLFLGKDIGEYERWKGWCARAEERMSLAEGKIAIRYAFFYPPIPPVSYELPKDEEAEGLLDRCVLGLIWIMGPEGVGNGNEISTSIRQAITSRYGDVSKANIYFVGSMNWKNSGSWQFGRTTLVSAYSNDDYMAGQLVFGFLPNSGLDISGPSLSSWESRWPKTLKSVREIMDTTGIEGPARTEMEELLKLNEQWQKGISISKDEMTPQRAARALESWLGETKEFSDYRKAASLLAADVVLNEVQHAFGISKPINADVRETLSKIGAHFIDYESPGGGVAYTRSWLHSARQLDKEGPIGDKCFLILMERGFDTSQDCQEGSAQFNSVIAQGEEYLRHTRDQQARREVELMVAEAYRDIVALATGLDSEHANPSDYERLEPEARRKAVYHFRGALFQTSDSQEYRIAWSEAWRLIAGLPPMYLRFWCVGD